MSERPCTCNRVTGPSYTLTQCRLCWLYHNDDRYHELWSETPASAHFPCVHLGAEQRRDLCSTCKGKVEVKVFACEVHGECTQAKRAEGVNGCCGMQGIQGTTPRSASATVLLGSGRHVLSTLHLRTLSIWPLHPRPVLAVLAVPGSGPDRATVPTVVEKWTCFEANRAQGTVSPFK